MLERGVFAGAPIDLADGYIHLSTIDQLAGTVDKHFAGQRELYLVKVELAALANAIRWEESRGGALFPHIYGLLPMSAVLAHGPLVRIANGGFNLPINA